MRTSAVAAICFASCIALSFASQQLPAREANHLPIFASAEILSEKPISTVEIGAEASEASSSSSHHHHHHHHQHHGKKDWRNLIRRARQAIHDAVDKNTATGKEVAAAIDKVKEEGKLVGKVVSNEIASVEEHFQPEIQNFEAQMKEIKSKVESSPLFMDLKAKVEDDLNKLKEAPVWENVKAEVSNDQERIEKMLEHHRNFFASHGLPIPGPFMLRGHIAPRVSVVVVKRGDMSQQPPFTFHNPMLMEPPRGPQPLPFEEFPNNQDGSEPFPEHREHHHHHHGMHVRLHHIIGAIIGLIIPIAFIVTVVYIIRRALRCCFGRASSDTPRFYGHGTSHPGYAPPAYHIAAQDPIYMPVQQSVYTVPVQGSPSVFVSHPIASMQQPRSNRVVGATFPHFPAASAPTGEGFEMRPLN